MQCLLKKVSSAGETTKAKRLQTEITVKNLFSKVGPNQAPLNCTIKHLFEKNINLFCNFLLKVTKNSDLSFRLHQRKKEK